MEQSGTILVGVGVLVLEFGERFEETAIRELAEETGIAIGENAQVVAPLETVDVLGTVMPEEKLHAIVPFVCAYVGAGCPEPERVEPHKCAGWEWMAWGALKAMDDTELFGPLRDFVRKGEWEPAHPGRE
ncbi:NUDIX hydrolase [Thecamonas trahens ATCC 50062]|uniref:NUDIX hydrolase n=1 Tax=Thecamonas trahens ATCC 50062 TaxID=461836 RepID=A0A0L0DHI1_THETB|nr:NUDIX hydrolase [Thecamonas trahens ATCC 50062]KNC51772.1 NUDIX hydrolase [Thecamonas trahens ATCC 50062]|eukprot:XP_013755645.1 NUDIX hydrolase [Thecamonas trahens ATCC 50062]